VFDREWKDNMTEAEALEVRVRVWTPLLGPYLAPI